MLGGARCCHCWRSMPAVTEHLVCFSCRYGPEASTSSKAARRAVEAEADQAPSRGRDLLHRIWRSGVRLELHRDRIWHDRALDPDLAAEARAHRDDLLVALRVEGSP